MHKTDPQPDVSRPIINKLIDGDSLTLILKGHWYTHSIHFVDDEVRQLEKQACRHVVIDISAVSGLDTGGAWLIKRLSNALNVRATEVKLIGVAPGWQSLLRSVGRVRRQDENQILVSPNRWLNFFGIKFLNWLGRCVVNIGHDFWLAMHILGAIISGLWGRRGWRSGLNIASLITQMDRMGVGAVPIIMLMSFIVGAIIAQQGAFQLRYFGAEIFVVDLVGILIFRELGVLMTAIMIAGRSGSAITAEIGSMKMREEIDALTVMGMNAVSVLILPRLIALCIVLPLLSILADVAAIIGAALVAYIYSDISMEAFINRLHDAVWISTYLAGLIKAPFMALIIAIIASIEGMKVKGSAESLGRRVTSSVVKSIFIVVVIDGFFAIFYASINF